MFKNLFGPKTKLVKGELYAPMTGEAIAITEVPDRMFSEKILGDGVAIIPSSARLYSPTDGKISMLAQTNHAFGITTADNLEILVHIGLQTMELHGEGIISHVSAGQQVHRGDLIAEVDIELLQSKGYNPVTVISITNLDMLVSFHPHLGNVFENQTAIIEYEYEIEH